ncbi:MAG: putative NAD/FAD-binding protein [Idiomarinaceae bacterium HL-53]|nr:MAG: putative NAD/FAD-binding protein [Idiomarinaceae bacterium HL-53]CUS48899.1 Predicted NAD/FAD-binding protein [Idiomarinaceae bacterium HL-53]
MRIAVIGSGVAGLTAAHLLSEKHEVHVFEQAPQIGGHTATVDVSVGNRSYAIDTGFIVFNNKTYPLFRALMRELRVGWKDTEMSFSVKNPDNKLEYNGHNLNTLFAQRRNIFRPSFYRFLKEIVKFNDAAKDALQRSQDELDTTTLDSFVSELELSQTFRDNYLFPMCAAIWSASLKDVESFPLGFFLRFFVNHGLLDLKDRPQWHVIKGGSRSYLKPLTQRFAERIHVNFQIERVERLATHVLLHEVGGIQHTFDEVVFACHSDQALALLGDATDRERDVLGRIPYQANDVVLHTDVSQLPNNKRAWASWNYLLPSLQKNDEQSREKPATLTYNMNILQGFQAPETFCVTLNNTSEIAGEKILRRFIYHHPVYSLPSFAARKARADICGKNRTHFCGAYWYNGFHEDGVRSANDLAARFSVSEITPREGDGVFHE